MQVDIQPGGGTLRRAGKLAGTASFALSGLLRPAGKWTDALGLGLFTSTRVVGGVLRDRVCNEVPTTLRDHQPYAVCAFAGGWTCAGLWWRGESPAWRA
jgi:uncharacterized membrane protein YeiH